MAKAKLYKTKIKLPYVPAKTVRNAITIVYEPRDRKCLIGHFPIATADIIEGVTDYSLKPLGGIKKIIDWCVDLSECGRKLIVK